MTIEASVGGRRALTREERKVIIASSAGTVFEWYDFYPVSYTHLPSPRDRS